MTDDNVAQALKLIVQIGTTPVPLPPSLISMGIRVNFMEAIERFVAATPIYSIKTISDPHLKALSEIGHRYLPELPSEMDRINVCLRFWVGCIAAAKAIAYKTNDGINTSDKRQEAFRQIDEWAKADPVFKAGVETAPIFKMGRKELIFLEGVPPYSCVRTFLS